MEVNAVSVRLQGTLKCIFREWFPLKDGKFHGFPFETQGLIFISEYKKRYRMLLSITYKSYIFPSIALNFIQVYPRWEITIVSIAFCLCF